MLDPVGMYTDEDELAYMTPTRLADPLAKVRAELRARGLYPPRRRQERYSRRCVFVDRTSLKLTDKVLCECRPCRTKNFSV